MQLALLNVSFIILASVYTEQSRLSMRLSQIPNTVEPVTNIEYKLVCVYREDLNQSEYHHDLIRGVVVRLKKR